MLNLTVFIKLRSNLHLKLLIGEVRGRILAEFLVAHGKEAVHWGMAQESIGTLVEGCNSRL
jgi:hypothetical protein